MNKTSIPYVDYSFNLVTGCYHKCKYCYARKIANRFKPKNIYSNTKLIITTGCACYEQLKGIKEPFPYGFIPTIYWDRVGEPAKKAKPSRIFHCDMGDLFGEWVPNSWIDADLLDAIESVWHTHLWLTKNPSKMVSVLKSWRSSFGSLNHRHFYFGTSVTCQNDIWRVKELVKIKEFMPDAVLWVSVEPMLGPVSFQEYAGECGGGCYNLLINLIDWVVAGPLTGVKGLFEPQWLCDLAQECKTYKVPFYDKRDVIGMGLREYLR
jgi:protein gp37